jgi:flavin prenyltransferase
MSNKIVRDETPGRVVLGISGASGAIYGIRMLDALGELGVETHLVISKAAGLVIAAETGLSPRDIAARADFSYPINDISASIASGSFPVGGMIVAPCSIRTMSEIATGTTASLLTRAADVTLKERRPLVLMVRETPLHLGHLRNLTALAEMGAIILPPVPAFYTAPKSVMDIVDQTVARALDCFGYNWSKARRWGVDLPGKQHTRKTKKKT